MRQISVDGTVERDVYYDPLADLFSAGFGMLFDNFKPSEDRLNDAAFVHDIPADKIYAATLNRITETPVNLRAGQKVTILGRGRINPAYSRVPVNNDGKWLKTGAFSTSYLRVNPDNCKILCTQMWVG